MTVALRCIVVGALALLLSGCLAATVVGATVGVAGAVVGGTVKGAGMVVGAVIPGGKDKKDR
jgi:hypothetical protein